MNRQEISEELLMLLEQNGVVIRREALGGGGGLCSIKNQSLFFVDTQASSTEVAVLCAEAVAKLVDIERIYIRPEVRQFIEKYAEKGL